MSPLAGVDMDRLRDAMETCGRREGSLAGEMGRVEGCLVAEGSVVRAGLVEVLEAGAVEVDAAVLEGCAISGTSSRVSRTERFSGWGVIRRSMLSRSVCGAAAGSAGIGNEPFRADIYQCPVYSRADEAERKGHGVSYVVGIAEFKSAG